MSSAVEMAMPRPLHPSETCMPAAGSCTCGR
ncbi:Uncharacterised protein [Bordetella pertussis]|nr:Uncharacterised protein [Bordetella pertussis]